MREPGGRKMAKKKLLKSDLIYTNVRKIINQQQVKSKVKFGVTMQARKKPLKVWIKDVQEELVDALLYLEKIKYDLQKAYLGHKSNKGKY